MKTWRMNENYKDRKLVSVEFQICKDGYTYKTIGKFFVKDGMNGMIDARLLNYIYTAYNEGFQQDKFIMTQLDEGE